MTGVILVMDRELIKEFRMSSASIQLIVGLGVLSLALSRTFAVLYGAIVVLSSAYALYREQEVKR